MFALSVLLSAAEIRAGGTINPNLFFTVQDVAKGRANMESKTGTKYFELLQNQAERDIQRYLNSSWHGEGTEGIRKSMDWSPGRAPYTNNMVSMSVYFLLTGNKDAAHKLHADLLRASRGYEVHGIWRPQGIHEAMTTIGLLMAYDSLKATGIFNEKETLYVEEMFHAAGKRLFGLLTEDVQRDMKLFNFIHAELCAVGSIALMFPQFEESEEWLKVAMQIYESSISRDYFRDGGYGEGAINYGNVSLYPLFLFTEAVRNQKGLNYWALPSYAKTFHSAGEWILEVMPPNGTSWALGDSPRDRGHRIGLYEYLASRTRDARFRWAAEAALTNGDLFTHDGAVDLALMFADFNINPQKPYHTHSLFPFSGYSFHKQGWDKGDGTLSIRYGPGGRAGPGYPEGYSWPAHSHPDILHLEYAWDGQVWLRDYGATSYSNPAHFLWYRSTAAHNTVGLQKHRPIRNKENKDDNFYRIHGEYLHGKSREEAVQRFVYPGNKRLFLSGEVGDWSYFSAEAMTFSGTWHRRSFMWNRQNGLLFVADDITAESQESFEWYWNFEGDCEPSGQETMCVTAPSGDVILIKRMGNHEQKWEQITQAARPMMPDNAKLLKWQKSGTSAHGDHLLLPGKAGNWKLSGDHTAVHKDGSKFHFPSMSLGSSEFRSAMIAESEKGTLLAWALIDGTRLEYDGSLLASSNQEGTSFFFDFKNRQGVIHTPWINDSSKYNAPSIEAEISLLLPEGCTEIKVNGETIKPSSESRFEFSIGHGSTSVEW